MHNNTGDLMNEIEYKSIVKKHTPKEDRLKNSIIAFISGGFIGLIGELLIEFYQCILNVSFKDASTYMILTLIFIASLFTCLGFFDNLVSKFKAGLFIPITGFAHSMMSATLDSKKEGLITGIGSNMFKLAGTVIIYGIVSSFIFGIVRIIIDI